MCCCDPSGVLGLATSAAHTSNMSYPQEQSPNQLSERGIPTDDTHWGYLIIKPYPETSLSDKTGFT